MSEHSACPPLKMRTAEKFDGSIWRMYESPDSLVLLTGSGRHLMAAGGIASLLHRYRDDYYAGAENNTDTRQFLAEGGNARIFSVGDRRLAVKEKRPGSNDDLFAALERMDRLVHAVIKHCPGWIGVPDHYGIVMPKENKSKQFMLMEKIDQGVTVGDVKHFYVDPPREPSLKAAAESLYGPITDEFREEIIGRYGMILGEVRKALMAEYLSPDTFLPDLDTNPYNIVLEPLNTPVDGSDIKF